MSGSELESKTLTDGKDGYNDSNDQQASSVQAETNETFSEPDRSETGQCVEPPTNTKRSQETQFTGALTKTQATERSYNYPEQIRKENKEKDAPSDRLLDRINKQKDRLAKEQARQVAEHNSEIANTSQSSDLMEQAWKNIDSNVRRLTSSDKVPKSDPQYDQLPDAPFSGSSGGSPEVAWNSSPDQITGGQIALRQPGLAQQLPYTPYHEPPKIPAPVQTQNPYISEIQPSQSLSDTLWDDNADPVFTQSAHISEQSKTSYGSRLLGLGITVAVLSTGLYFISGKVHPIITELYRLQQTAQDDKVQGSKVAKISGDLAQQTIASPIPDDNTIRDQSESNRLSLQNHESAIREKLGTEVASLPDRQIVANDTRKPNQLKVNAGKPVGSNQILSDSITGPAGQNLAIKLKLPSSGYDGNGTLEFMGIPEEVMLSTGTRGDRKWTIPVRDLDGLTLISDPEFQGPFDVSVALRDSSNFITARNTLSVNIEPFRLEKTRKGQAAADNSISEGQSSQTQNIIRSTSIIGAEKGPIPRQTNTGPLGESYRAPIRQPADQLSPSLSARLLARGNRLLQNGDIASARLAFEHLANNGHAAGAYALAQTYDPQWMANKAVSGIHGDIAKAIQWYKVAADLGQINANGRLRELELDQR